MTVRQSGPTMSFQTLTGANLQYKVWVHVERHDPDSGTYEDIGLPDPLGRFTSLATAQAFVRTLPGWKPDGSDNRLRD
ncbi:MAG: hypothetical protein M3P30_02370 [Chloroflexota bacterium]|nr:hypothetical protein [Chloroflexota bacterium]